MSQSRYSPLMLTAVAGLLQNQGLSVNAGLLSALSQYNAIDIVSQYRTLLTNAINGGVVGTNITAMQSLELPAVTNAVTSSYVSTFGPLAGDDVNGLTGRVLAQANIVMGNGNLGKFVQIYSAAQSYVIQANEVVDSVIASDSLSDTFVGMGVLITGSVSDVSSNTAELARDLQRLGQAWNLNDLDWLGFPSTLIRQLNRAGGILPELVGAFAAQGVTTNQLADVISSRGPAALETELKLYTAMQQVKGSVLSQVNLLLDVTTLGLSSMADLLNPAKVLPNSFRSLTLRVAQPSAPNIGATTAVLVYLPNGSVNSNLTTEFAKDARYKNLSRVIPGDQALATRCIARSLQQIKNIFIPPLGEFSTAVETLENVQDLLLISALTRPVPLADRNSLLGTLATGTGPGGSVTLFDMIGSAAGVPYRELYQQLLSDTQALQATGALSSLTNSTNGVFTIMQNTIDGDYTEIVEIPGEDEDDPPTILYFIEIPTGLPGAGSYGGTTDFFFALNSAFAQGLIPAANAALSSVAAAQPTLSQRTTATVDAIVTALINETQNFARTELDLDELSEENRSGLMSLAGNLHELGTDIGPTGSAPYFEAIADRSNIHGQAIEAAMREGRNIEKLNGIGIDLDTQIPLQPPE